MSLRTTVTAHLAWTLLLLLGPLTAQTGGGEPVSEALQRDAIAYSEQFGTDIEEALRRLELQSQIGALDEILSEETRTSFGGLWIEHQPEFKIVVLFTSDSPASGALSEATVGELSELIEVREATVSLAQLEAELEQTQERLQKVGAVADLWINVRRNQVEVMTPDPLILSSKLSASRVSLPPHTRVMQVSSLSRPLQLQTDIRGGRPLSTCTSGFNVQSSTGVLGVSTAGHCGNSQTYQDTNRPLTFQSERYRGSHDVQWHRAGCNDVIRNEIFDGTGNRAITRTVSRSAQTVGTFVCKHGMTTGETCGTITSRSFCPSYVPSGNTTFITVQGGTQIAAGGDSGAPWYADNRAYGIMSGVGGDGDRIAVYMAVDYMSSQGYSVLRYQAGVNPYASISCSNDNLGFSCWASGRSGSPPYTFSNWQYSGPASSWGANGSGVSGIYSFPGCTNSAYNSVTVQITDACGRTGHGSASFNCPDPQSCQNVFICEIN